MATIVPFLWGQDIEFGPKDVTILSIALDDVCDALNIGSDDAARQTIAARIVELARQGERNPKWLCERVLHEAAMAEYVEDNKR
jgi:hypothetical protein